MPLNSAVYEPGRDRIYAVRDNWIFELNASTGAKVSEARFTPSGIAGDVYIDYDTVTDRLWTSFWRTTQDVNGNLNTVRAIVSINPSDITSFVLYPNSGAMSVGGYSERWDAGHRKMVTRGGIGWFLYSRGGEPEESFVARINLAVPIVTNTSGISGAAGATWASIFYDGSILFVGSNADEGANTLNPADLTGIGTGTGEIALRFPYGVTRNPGGFCYFATGTQYVTKAEVGGGLTASTIDLGKPLANPHNIRYNSYDGLIYIPLYRDDTVAVLNPSDDSFTFRTGFTNPWDCVFTITKKFAIQHSGTGLKEITP